MIFKKQDNENIVDKETMNKIKKELLARKDQILKEINEITEKNIDKDQTRAKFPNIGEKIDENAQEIDVYSTNIATEKILESTLRDIEGALDRIKTGAYGICKYCKKPIGKKRMLARPVASACVECKTKLQNTV